MATRMQQRRGTAAQWTGANPVLNAGEIGFETDTNKFKIGDGANDWDDLDYFIDETGLGTTLGDYVETSLLGQVNGVATLNASGKLESSQVPNIDELAQDAVDAALIAGTGLNKIYNDNANTITLDIDSTVATLTGEQTLTNKTLTTPVISSITNTGTLTLPSTTGTVALTSDITTAINNLVDGAPAALDTLNEIAAALNDEASYANTIVDSLATKASLTGTETLTNKTLTSPTINTGIATQSVNISPEERWNVVASAATGTIDIDVNTAGVWYYTSDATANHTLNFRGSSGATLDSILATGDSVSVVWLNTNGATPYYPNVYQIDGATNNRTLRWQNATAPSAGNASSVDAYIFTIAKTAANTFSVFASSTRFA